MIGNAQNGYFHGILRYFDNELKLKSIISARDYKSSKSNNEDTYPLWNQLEGGPKIKPIIIFRSTLQNRIFVVKNTFEGPVYNCHDWGLAQRFRKSYSLQDCYTVNTTFNNLPMRSYDCNPVIDPSPDFTLNSSLKPFIYNLFGDEVCPAKNSLYRHCKYEEDAINGKETRTRIERWLNIVSDKENHIGSTELGCLDPFESSETPEINIFLGYLSNRNRFNYMKYKIFKYKRLLHEGVMMNGRIYSEVSIGRMYDWVGTLTIIIGNLSTTEEMVNNGKFVIQTQLYKSKLHGIVRVWGKLPNDPKDDCELRMESGLGLICKYSNGIPSGKCWKGLLGGAWIYGEMTKDGEFTGNDVAYINQDMNVGYKGIFHKAKMINATVVNIIGEQCNEDGIKILIFSDSISYRDNTYRFKRPGPDFMGDKPFVVDPLDNKYIDVGQSSINTSEDSQDIHENGAFAKVDIPPRTVISHNNGYIVNGKERNEWIQNQMKLMRLTKKNDKTVIKLKVKFEEDFKKSTKKYSGDLLCNEYLEIPSEVGQKKSKYRSTRGHKINHSFTQQNARYILYDSAQFGIVMAISTLNKKRILKGEEIFVHYGYTYSDGPKWYQESFIDSQVGLLNTGNKLEPEWQLLRDKIFSEANITTVLDATNPAVDTLLKQYQHYTFQKNA